MARRSELMACYQATKLPSYQATKLPSLIELASVTGHCEIKTLEGYYNVKAETLVAKLA